MLKPSWELQLLNEQRILSLVEAGAKVNKAAHRDQATSSATAPRIPPFRLCNSSAFNTLPANFHGRLRTVSCLQGTTGSLVGGALTRVTTEILSENTAKDYADLMARSQSSCLTIVSYILAELTSD